MNLYCFLLYFIKIVYCDGCLVDYDIKSVYI